MEQKEGTAGNRLASRLARPNKAMRLCQVLSPRSRGTDMAHVMGRQISFD